MKASRFVILLLVSLLAFFPGVSQPSPAVAEPNGLTFIAKFGDPLPAPFPPTPPPTVDQLSPPDVNDDGWASFYVQANTGQSGVAIGNGTSLDPHAIDGEQDLQSHYMWFTNQMAARPLTNEVQEIAYTAEWSVSPTGTKYKGLYLSPGPGTPITIVKENQTCSDPPGMFGPPEVLDFNDNHKVLFSADVTGGPEVDALFLGDGSTISTLVKVNDPVPSRIGGGYIASLGSAVMDNSDNVAFKATVSGGSVSEAIFLRESGGNLTRVVAEGDIWFTSPALNIPGTAETTCDETPATCEANPEACDNDGDGRINDGCPPEGPAETRCKNPFDYDGDTKVNDGCPTMAEVRFDSVDKPAINDNGVVAFYATFDAASPYTNGYLMVETSSAYEDGKASCYDKLDNGGDGSCDYHGCTMEDDPDCTAASANEFGGTPDGSCGNGLDDDGDGTCDNYPGCSMSADADCSAATDTPHEDGSASCSDGKDNGRDDATDNADSDCQQASVAVLPENPSILGSSFGGGGCSFDLQGDGPHLLGGGAFGGGFVQGGCGGDPVEAVLVFPAHDKLVITNETIPGGGGVFQGFSNPAISDSSFVAFNATDSLNGPSIVVTPAKCAKDSDGDGLCDGWEENGIDSDNDGDLDLDLPTMEADKDKKDIFVEIDYVDCRQGGCESEDNAGPGTCGDGIDNGGEGKCDTGNCPGVSLPADPDCTVVGTDRHHHVPIQAAINNVITAFANSTAYNPTDSEDGAGDGTCSDGNENGTDNLKDAEDPDCTGINLHVIIDEAIPHYQYLDFPPASNKANPQPCVDGVGGTQPGGANTPKVYDFNKVKDAKFGTSAERGNTGEWKSTKAAKEKVFHYALFTHMQAPNNSSSGCAEIWGNDFYVSLGAWAHEGIGGPFTCTDGQDNDGDGDIDAADSDCTSGVVGTQVEHEGTFMHELGHNLDLRHGGDDDSNYKPNYLSVMSYTFQMPYIVANRLLDYSRWVLPTPVEDKSAVPGSCADGSDNGNDGVKDWADPDCQKPPGAQSEGLWADNCSDTYDNDNDGNADAADSDCPAGGVKGVEGKPAQYCGDNYDNDNDGLTDFEDPDCSVGVLNEFSLIESEGIDDGSPPAGLASLQTAFTEFPNEYGVDGDGDTNPDDLNSDGQIKKADNEKGAGSCYDTIDNDGDTLVDGGESLRPGGQIDCVGVAPSLAGEGRDTCFGGGNEDGDALIDTADEDCQCRFRVVAATGPIDWNINGLIEGVGAPPGGRNVNTPIMDPKDKCLTAMPNQKAHGWDDWHNLNLNFRPSGNYSDGLPNVPLPEEQELPPVQIGPSGPPAVGGTAEYPDAAQGAGWPVRNYIALAGGVAAVLGALTAAAWYARRRWLS